MREPREIRELATAGDAPERIRIVLIQFTTRRRSSLRRSPPRQLDHLAHACLTRLSFGNMGSRHGS
jgi:hypothetical protein